MRLNHCRCQFSNIPLHYRWSYHWRCRWRYPLDSFHRSPHNSCQLHLSPSHLLKQANFNLKAINSSIDKDIEYIHDLAGWWDNRQKTEMKKSIRLPCVGSILMSPISKCVSSTKAVSLLCHSSSVSTLINGLRNRSCIVLDFWYKSWKASVVDQHCAHT